MALKKTFNLPSGLVAVNAYHKIDTLSLTQNSLTVSVRVFATQEARDADNPSIAEMSYMLPFCEDVSLESAYTALKLFPDYIDAEDC